MGRKFLCVMLSIILAMSISVNVFADENMEGEEQVKVSVVQQFIGEIFDIPTTNIDDPNTEEDETTNIVYGKAEGYSFTSGDVKEGDNDPEYNYTVTTILKQGAIKIKTTNVSIGKNSKNVKLDYLNNEVKPTGREGNDLIADVPAVEATGDYLKNIGGNSGYEFVYLGADKLSEFLTAHGWNEQQPGANDEPRYTDDKYSIYVCNQPGQLAAFKKAGLKVDRYYLDDKVVEADGRDFYARWADMQQFVVADAEGNLLTAYCADQQTGAEKGYRYNIENLEDATYYSEEEAANMRAIANNGYWGTKEGVGSLAAVKEMMRESGKFTDDEIKGLTDGMALMATQYAIWTYSNVKDKVVFLNAYHNTNGKYVPAAKDDTDLIFKLYRHLVSLDPDTSAKKNTNQRAIINENNFFDKASMKITDSLTDAPENNDEDDTNDVFKTDISFVLSMSPEELEGDELVMNVRDEEGNILATGRVAGTQKPGEIMLTPDENNAYTFEDVTMHEGAQNIKFDLSGTQEVENAPYLLTSEVINGESSQTFVCFGGGTRDVAMTMDISCEISVEPEEFEERNTFKEPPADEPGEDPYDKNKEKEPATETDKDKDVEKETKTGDDFNLPLVLALLFASVAVAVVVLRKKKYN